MATTPAPDPQLAYDSEQMKLLLQHPGWGVLKRRLEEAQEHALRRVMNWADGDQLTHHFRGVYTTFRDVLALPEGIIAAERAARRVK